MAVAEYHEAKEKDWTLFHGFSFLAAAVLSLDIIQYFFLAFIPSDMFRVYRHFNLIKNYFLKMNRLWRFIVASDVNIDNCS